MLRKLFEGYQHGEGMRTENGSDDYADILGIVGFFSFSMDKTPLSY